ncbi:MAG: nucleoside recognition protein [Thermodesulfobacteriota bacterium]|nr:nucleoside recognition protein [Thermodesulfobacteriota bacterium]
MMHKEAKPKYISLTVSFALSAAVLFIGIYTINDLSVQKVVSKLLWPLLRLMLFIGAGLAAGQLIEASGWTKRFAVLARPFFKFGNLGDRCSAAFTTAFISGVAANAMLLDFFKDDKISRRQLFLTNFVNQFPAFFLHLPTTVFIVLPLTGFAGAIYFIITFTATLFRTVLFIFYGHLRLSIHTQNYKNEKKILFKDSKNQEKGLWERIKEKFPKRIIDVTIYVVPVYIIVFLLNDAGVFNMMRSWLADYFVTAFMPVEALSVIILSFAAEFTSGFAAAGALLDAGVITTKQTVLALIIGNIIAFPIRALRHQLPRYIGIFSPKMGTQLLLMGQGFRVVSLVIMGTIYYYLG